MTTSRPAAVRPQGLPLRALALAAAAASLLALAGTWTWGRLHPTAPPAAPDRSGSDGILRRTEVAFADAQAVWHRLRGEARYAPAVLVFFTGATGTPCAGGATVSGPFYCPETGTAAFDLDFLAEFGPRLQRQGDLGLALVAARLSAGHLQREAGVLDAAALRMIGARRAARAAITAELALQADCLTGVWAAAAAARIGPVPEGFWSQLVWSWRNTVEELAARRVRVAPEFDAFATGTQEERAAAFARGYAAAGLDGCPAPAEG